MLSRTATIVMKLHQAATELAGGNKLEEVCKALTISPATYYRWQEQYGGADADTVKEENTQLKRLVADLSLDKVTLKELLEGTGRHGAETRSRGPSQE